MPDEMLLHIFFFLPAQGIAKSQQVCKNWKSIAEERVVWKHLLQRKFPFLSATSGGIEMDPQS